MIEDGRRVQLEFAKVEKQRLHWVAAPDVGRGRVQCRLQSGRPAVASHSQALGTWNGQERFGRGLSLTGMWPLFL